MKVDFGILAVSGELWIRLNNITTEDADLKLFQFHHNDLAVAMTRIRVRLVKNATCMHVTVHRQNCILGVTGLPR